QRDTGPREQPSRRWDRDHVVPRRPGEVLDHLAVRGSGEPDGAGDAARVRGGENDTSRFDGDVRAGPDRDADVRARQRGRVVDPVADHRRGQAPGLQPGDDLVLVLREHLGGDLVDTGPEVQIGGDRLGDRPGVAGDHRDLLDAQFAELGDGLRGLRAYLVLQGDGPEHLRRAVQLDQVQHRGATGRPVSGLVAQVPGRYGVQLPQ